MTGVKQSDSKIKRQANKEMLTQVRFGMLSKKCRSYGICEVKKIDDLSLITKRENKKTVCNVELVNDRQLRCSFDLNSITEEGRFKYFGKEHFRMGEAYKIPEYISSYFGIERTQIRPGSYPIIQLRTTIVTVLFDLDIII